MPGRAQPTSIPVIFDESILTIDLQRLPTAAATSLSSLRRDVHRSGGISRNHLKRCQAHARDGTNLAGCVKTYVPWPDGPWGIVFRAGEDARRPFALYMIAYGHRHPGARRASVYQIAHRRLQCREPAPYPLAHPVAGRISSARWQPFRIRVSSRPNTSLCRRARDGGSTSSSSTARLS